MCFFLGYINMCFQYAQVTSLYGNFCIKKNPFSNDGILGFRIDWCVISCMHLHASLDRSSIPEHIKHLEQNLLVVHRWQEIQIIHRQVREREKAQKCFIASCIFVRCILFFFLYAHKHSSVSRQLDCALCFSMSLVRYFFMWTFFESRGAVKCASVVSNIGCIIGLA